MKIKSKFLIISVLSLTLLSCGKNFSKMSFNDGIFEGEHINEEGHKDVMKVKIELKDNKIISCEMQALDEKGNLKDENYAKDAGEKNYELAQKSVEAMKVYPERLLEVQDPEKIDAEAGATVSNKQFKEAVWNALEKAKK